MLVHDGSTDSLAELSENVHQQLNAHFDHMGLMQYEMEMLRAQLSEKDRIVSHHNTLRVTFRTPTNIYSQWSKPNNSLIDICSCLIIFLFQIRYQFNKLQLKSYRMLSAQAMENLWIWEGTLKLKLVSCSTFSASSDVERSMYCHKLIFLTFFSIFFVAEDIRLLCVPKRFMKEAW